MPKNDPSSKIKKMIVTEEVASKLGMPFETLNQLYENIKGLSGMDLDTSLSDRDYLDAAARTALEGSFSYQASHHGWQSAVVFLALVCRNPNTWRVFKNPATLDEIRYGLDQNTLEALRDAFRFVSPS